jgi:hypothetical protein
VISPHGHCFCGETVTPPRYAFRFAACVATLPLQGRVKKARHFRATTAANVIASHPKIITVPPVGAA